jgi:streptomycin 6-kinase
VTYRHLDHLRGSARGRTWLDALPGLVDACARRWSLQPGDPFDRGYASLAMHAILPDGADAVLKVQFPHRETEHEAAALQVWEGEGAVRLLAHDLERHALLLERARPGEPLASLGDPDAALDVVIGLLPRLWKPAGAPFRSLAEEAAELSAEMGEHRHGAGRAVDGRLVDAATEAFAGLAATQGEQVLVNQDLHADNVLSAQREPWLVIDPKPLAGEREFGVAAIVRSRELGHSRAAVLRRLDRMSAELGLDRERVRLWAMAHTVAWGFDDEGRPIGEHMDAATWLLEAG